MEAPEKIYIPRLEGSDILVQDWSDTKFRRYFNIDVAENVEYVRADTFIAKACNWLQEQEEITSLIFQEDFLERFENYMKG